MVFFVVSAVAAQDAGGRASGGGTRQQNRLDINSLRDTTGSDGLDKRNKLLKDIREAIANGDTGDDIYTALEYMSKEGLSNRTIRQGQLLNDYPTIRRDVATELGKMGTAKATDILNLLCRNEKKEFDVQLAAINALGNIGINENGLTVEAIFSIPKLRDYKAQSTSDDDFKRLVSSAIVAFDKIDRKNNGLGNKSKAVQEFLDNISKIHFTKGQDQIPLHERAKQTLEEIIKRESQRNQSS